MVICAGCRIIFAPEWFGAVPHHSDDCENGSLGLGFRVDEADVIFRPQQQQQPHQQHPKARPYRSKSRSQITSSPPPPSLSTYKSETALRKSTSHPPLQHYSPSAEEKSLQTTPSTTNQGTSARRMMMRRQASLNRFRGSQHSKRSSRSTGSRAA